MKKQDFVERKCEGFDGISGKCKYGHKSNGGYLCKGHLVFNLYEEKVTDFKVRLPECLEE
ncbi:hypothetical protein D3C71_2141220 [compost metagenome]